MRSIRKYFIGLFVIAAINCGQANNVSITNVTYNDVANTLNFDLSWDNSFYVNSDWQDKVYVFAKFKNGNSSSWDRVMFETYGNGNNSATMDFDYAGKFVITRW